MPINRVSSFSGVIIFCNLLFGWLLATKPVYDSINTPELARINRQQFLLERLNKLKEDKTKVPSSNIEGLKYFDGYDASNGKHIKGQIELVQDELERLNNFGGEYEWLAETIAGDSAKYLRSVTPKNWYSAVGYGLGAQTISAFSNFLHTKMKSTIDILFGGVWDWSVNKIRKAFNHDSFDDDHLNMWQFRFVDKLDVVYSMVTKGFQDGMRGLDQTSRQFDDANSNSANEGVNGGILPPVDEVWKMFVYDCIYNDFNVFVDTVESARKEYDDGDPILSYLMAIENLLKLIFVPMSTSTSLADFDKKLGPNKACLVTVKTAVQRYFREAAAIARSKNAIFNKLSPTQSSSTTSSSYRNNSDNNNYPQPLG